MREVDCNGSKKSEASRKKKPTPWGFFREPPVIYKAIMVEFLMFDSIYIKNDYLHLISANATIVYAVLMTLSGNG